MKSIRGMSEERLTLTAWLYAVAGLIDVLAIAAVARVAIAAGWMQASDARIAALVTLLMLVFTAGVVVGFLLVQASAGRGVRAVAASLAATVALGWVLGAASMESAAALAMVLAAGLQQALFRGPLRSGRTDSQAAATELAQRFLPYWFAFTGGVTLGVLAVAYLGSDAALLTVVAVLVALWILRRDPALQ